MIGMGKRMNWKAAKAMRSRTFLMPGGKSVVLLHVAQGKAEEDEHGDVVILRPTDAGGLGGERRVGFSLELVDAKLGLPAIALPLEQRDLRERNVHHRDLEGGNPDEGAIEVRAVHRSEELHLDLGRFGDDANAVSPEPRGDERLDEVLVPRLHERFDIDAGTLELREVELAEGPLQGPDEQLLGHALGFRGMELAGQGTAPGEEPAHEGEVHPYRAKSGRRHHAVLGITTSTT